ADGARSDAFSNRQHPSTPLNNSVANSVGDSSWSLTAGRLMLALKAQPEAPMSSRALLRLRRSRKGEAYVDLTNCTAGRTRGDHRRHTADTGKSHGSSTVYQSADVRRFLPNTDL